MCVCTYVCACGVCVCLCVRVYIQEFVSSSEKIYVWF